MLIYVLWNKKTQFALENSDSLADAATNSLELSNERTISCKKNIQSKDISYGFQKMQYKKAMQLWMQKDLKITVILLNK